MFLDSLQPLLSNQDMLRQFDRYLVVKPLEIDEIVICAKLFSMFLMHSTSRVHQTDLLDFAIVALCYPLSL